MMGLMREMGCMRGIIIDSCVFCIQAIERGLFVYFCDGFQRRRDVLSWIRQGGSRRRRRRDRGGWLSLPLGGLGQLLVERGVRVI